ncbi:MAG: aspartate dehydrogenase [Lachnospiraceae bacterium]|nr:aspartate dehydrogenase [Lachnospiraceae bacterium]
MFRKIQKQKSYDKENLRPVIRASICNGEQVAGFKDVNTGKFTEVMLIRDHKDLYEFKEMYGIRDEEISKEW